MDARQRQQQLEYLFRKQDGKCHLCGEPAKLLALPLPPRIGPDTAVRFRTGSSFGSKGRVRRRVMAHRSCAQERSDEIQASQPIEETRERSGRFPTEYFVVGEPKEPNYGDGLSLGDNIDCARDLAMNYTPSGAITADVLDDKL